MSPSNVQRRRPTSVLATTALLASLASAQYSSSQTAIIAVEASHGGAGSNLSNTTISVPLNTLYTNENALNAVSTLYLSGARGVSAGSVTCYPYKNDDLTGQPGRPFSQNEPSRLSTNTVQVGSLICRSTDVSAYGYHNATRATSTLHATTTDVTRGHVSDVPNYYSIPLGPGPVIVSSSLSRGYFNSTMATSTTTSLTTVTPSNSGAGGNSPAVVTSTMIVIPSPSADVTSFSQSTQGPTFSTGAAVSGRRVDGLICAVVGAVGFVGLAILAG